MGEEYYGGDYLQDICEAALLEIGGQALLDGAHSEAAAHVDEHHPWDGRGDEPAERVSAYCAVLWQRVEVARTAAAGDMTSAGAGEPGPTERD